MESNSLVHFWEHFLIIKNFNSSDSKRTDDFTQSFDMEAFCRTAKAMSPFLRVVCFLDFKSKLSAVFWTSLIVTCFFLDCIMHLSPIHCLQALDNSPVLIQSKPRFPSLRTLVHSIPSLSLSLIPFSFSASFCLSSYCSSRELHHFTVALKAKGNLFCVINILKLLISR